MIDGWVKLHRKLLTWEWLDKPEMVSVFIYCLLRANHNGNEWRGMELKRGNFITSCDKMATTLGLSRQIVRTCLKRLENTHEINQKSTNKYTIITLNNYDTYQYLKNEDNQQKPHKKPTTNQQLTTESGCHRWLN